MSGFGFTSSMQFFAEELEEGGVGLLAEDGSTLLVEDGSILLPE